LEKFFKKEGIVKWCWTH